MNELHQLGSSLTKSGAKKTLLQLFLQKHFWPCARREVRGRTKSRAIGAEAEMQEVYAEDGQASQLQLAMGRWKETSELSTPEWLTDWGAS